MDYGHDRDCCCAICDPDPEYDEPEPTSTVAEATPYVPYAVEYFSLDPEADCPF